MSTPLSLRLATMSDAQILFDWRNDGDTRRVSRNTETLVWQDHLNWMQATLDSADRMLLVGMQGTRKIGTIRWDRISRETWEISITLAPESRGQGLALPMVLLAEQEIAQQAKTLVATAHEENLRSRRLFESAHYSFESGPDSTGYLTFTKNCAEERHD